MCVCVCIFQTSESSVYFYGVYINRLLCTETYMNIIIKV